MPPIVWSSQENTPWNKPSHRGLKLAAAVGVIGGVGIGLATTPVGQGVALDNLYRGLRHAGNLSPFSILNTFRAPQWLSTFTSPYAQSLLPASELGVSGTLPGPSNMRYLSIGENFLSDRETTTAWLHGVLGEEKLKAAGLDVSPFELLYGREAADRTGVGTLWARARGDEGWKRLSGSVSLFELTSVDPIKASAHRIQQEAINPAAVGILDALGVTEIWGRDANKELSRLLRSSSEAERGPLSRYMVIPSAFGPLEGEGFKENFLDISRRFSTYIGGPMAATMGRMNRLIQATADQLPVLRQLNYAFQNTFRMGLGVTPGSASKMFTRFGLKAAAVGAIGLGVAQTDWIRREYGILGHLAGTGITTAGITYAAHRLFNKTGLTLGIGAASAIGQLILPGFKEGLVPGAATTASNLHIIKSGVGAVTFMNSYRRTTEGLFPGISDWKTAALAGIGIAGFSYMGGSAALIKKYGYDGILPASLENFIGVDPTAFKGVQEPMLSLRQFYNQEIRQLAASELGAEYGTIMGRKEWSYIKNKRLYAALHRKGSESGQYGRILDEMDLSWERASTRFGEQVAAKEGSRHGIYTSLLSRLETIESSNMGTVKKFISKAGTKFWHAFLGADPAASGLRTELGRINSASYMGRLGLLLAGGMAGWSLLSGGLLGTLEKPGELADIYAGREYLEIKEAARWEAGGCFTEDSLVASTHCNYDYAGNFSIGDSIVNPDGTSSEIVKIYPRWHTGSVYRIDTFFNRTVPAYFTDNHIIKVLRKYRDRHLNLLPTEEVVQIPLSEIQPWDFVQVPIPLLSQEFCSINLLDYVSHYDYIIMDDKVRLTNNSHISTYYRLNLTPALGRLFGYFLSEGNISYQNRHDEQIPAYVEFAFAQHGKYLVEDLKQISLEVFGIEPTVRLKVAGSKTVAGHWIVRIYSSLIADFFFNFFYPTNKDKQFPEILMSTSSKFKEALVYGYWLGSGHIGRSKDERVISSSRPEYLHKIQMILLSLRVISTMTEEKTKTKTRYRIVWDKKYTWNKQGFCFYNGELFSKIASISERFYSGIVYDFETSHESHLLQVGSFVVHNSPYEGGKTKYLRPSNLFLLKTRAAAASEWGADEDRISPIKKFLLKNFTYEQERILGRDRPTPITSAFGEGIPIIGGAIASTIGRLIKPSKLQYVSDWVREGPNGIEFGHVEQPDEPSYQLGGLTPGVPDSPFAMAYQAGLIDYGFKELGGLFGFAANTLTKGVTGSETFATQRPVLDSAGSVSSATRHFWNMELGGFYGLTEGIRRFLPHDRSEVDTYNPIRNTQPSWLPDRFSCISPGSFVEVNGTEVERAQDIEPGMLIRTHTGRMAEISAIWPRIMDLNEKLYSVRISNLSTFKLEVSEQHPFWTEDGWQPICNLNIGDFVGYPIPDISTLTEKDTIIDLASFADKKSTITDSWIYSRKAKDLYKLLEYMEFNNVLYWKKGQVKEVCQLLNIPWSREIGAKARRSLLSLRAGNLIRIPRYISTADKDFANLIGWYTAKGSASNENITFSFCDNENLFISLIQKSILCLFGLNSSTHQYEDQRHGVSVIFSNKTISNFFKTYVGHNNHYKKLRVTYSNWKIVLRGLINGDGFYSNSPDSRIGLKSVNSNILYHMWQLFLANQIVGSIWKDSFDLKGYQAEKAASLIELDKAFEKISFTKHQRSNPNSGWWFFKDGYWWHKIVDKREISQQQLIAIEVIGDNSFCIPGTATHNTGDPYKKVANGEIRLPGSGYCLHPDVLIHTDKGICSISKIQINDKVLTSQGYEVVKNLFSREYSGDLICIDSYGGLNSTVALTSQHLVKAIKMKKCKYHKSANLRRRPCKHGNFCDSMKCADYDYQKIEWIEASDLQVGDYVLRPCGFEDNETEFSIDVEGIARSIGLTKIQENMYQSWRPLNNEIIKNKRISFTCNDFFWLAGLYLAEGSLGNGKVSFAINSKEQWLFERVLKEWPKARFNRRAALLNCANIEIGNILFARVIEEYFGRASLKRIPRNVTYNQFTEILSGLFQGDSQVTKETAILTVSTRYSKLLSDLFYLLDKFGIQWTAKYRIQKRNPKKGALPVWEIKILASSMHLLNLIGDKKIQLSNSKTISNFIINNHNAFKIRKIEVIQYSGTVYDIEVENSHEYTASFIVHNSAIHPELRGIDPEDYPDAYKYMILSDVASGSKEFMQTRDRIYKKRMSGLTSEAENRVIDMADERLNTVLAYQNFDNVHPNAIEIPGVARLTQGMWNTAQKALRKAVAPVEYLTPFRPIQKFMSKRNALEEYKYQQLGGCLVPETLIKIRGQGCKRIDSIVVGDEVLTYNGQWNKVTAVIPKNYKDIAPRLMFVRVRGGPEDIRITEDHQLYCWNSNSNEFCWVPAGEITMSDYSAVPIPHSMIRNDSQTYNLLDFIPEEEKELIGFIGNQIGYKFSKDSIKFRSKLVNQYILADEKLGRLLGYYLAEGCSSSIRCSSNPSYSINFTFHSKEIQYHQDVITLVRDLFGLDSSVKVEGNTTNIRINGKIIWLFFKSLVPGTALHQDKFLAVNTGTGVFLKELLKGLLRGDGHFSTKTKRITLASSCPGIIDLAFNISLLFRLPGVARKIQENYQLRWSNDISVALAELLQEPFPHERTGQLPRYCKIFDSYVCYPFEKIEFIDDSNCDLVYDLCVESSYSFGGYGNIIYHNSNAFWDQAWRDFIRPAMYTSLDMMSPVDFKPLWKQKVEEDKAYFDKLEFAKWMQIANSTTGEEKRQALFQANKTRYGVNPQGSPMAIYAAFPDSEKKFFDAFAYANGKERDRIREMIPEDQKHLYEAIWSRIDRGDKTLYPGSSTQVDEEYLAQRFNDLEGYFQDKPYPKEDWIGWNSAIDSSDIQLRYVDKIGADIHDYEMWERQNRLLSRKPYLEGSEDFLFEGHPMNRDNIAAKIYNAGKYSPSPPTNVSVHSNNGSLFRTQGRFYYNDDRQNKIMEMLNVLG